MSKSILPLVLIGAAILLTFFTARTAAIVKPTRDIQSFWAAAKQVKQNPYGAGMRNPPWAIPFVLPLGFFEYPTAFGVWTVTTLILIAGCGRVLWGVFATVPSLLPAVLTLVFGPTFCLLLMGQLDALTLAGLTLFLWAIRQNRHFLAGTSLLLVSIKPHIVLLFLFAVVLWAVRTRGWTVLAGAGLAVTVSTILVVLINHNVLSQYLQCVRSFTSYKDTDPNISGLIYEFSGRRSLALIPEIVGIVWLGFYFWRRRDDWDWNREGLLCILVSVLCSYYSFPYDEVVVLPAVLLCAATGIRTRLFVLFALINFGYYLYLSNTAGGWGFGSLFLSWTGTAWLIAYLVSRPRTIEESIPTIIEVAD